MLTFLIDNIFVEFAGQNFQQVIGIPMGTNCAPLLADLFLYSYEAEFIQGLLVKGEKKLAQTFNFSFRYIDDLLSLNNPRFHDFTHLIYPKELELKDTTDTPCSASYLDLFLKYDPNGKLYTRIYDKRDDFNFSIVNFPFLCSNIPASPAYGVYISQLIRYGRACSNYEDFIARGQLLTTRLQHQGYTTPRLKSTFPKFFGRQHDIVGLYEKSASGVIIHNQLESEEIHDLELALNKSRTLVNQNHKEAYSIDTVYIDLTNSFEVLRRVSRMIQQEGMSVLVVIGPESNYDVIRSYVEDDTIRIPLFFPIAIGNISCHDHSFHVNMMPSYVRAMVDIIKYYQWDTFYYIFDSDEGLHRLQDFYAAASDTKNMRLIIRPRRILNISNSYELLRSLDSAEPFQNQLPFKRIILDLSSRKAYNLTLEQIIDVGMNRDNYHYLLGGLGIDELNLSQFKYGGVNITGFTVINKGSTTFKSIREAYHREGPMYEKLYPIKFKQALVVDTFKLIQIGFQRFYWRAKNSNSQWRGGRRRDLKEDIIETFKQIKTPANGSLTGTIAFDSMGMRKNYELEVHQLELKTSLRKVGSWMPNGSKLNQRFKTKMTSPINTHSYEGSVNKTLRIVTILDEPFVRFATKENGDSNNAPVVDGKYLEGYCIDVAEKVKERYEKNFQGKKFNYEIHLSKTYGKVDKQTGIWDGIIGELLYNKADLAIAPLTINRERERVVDFTKPFMKIGISIMIKKPDKQKPGVFSFMSPLSNRVWMCVMIAFIAVSLVLFFVGRWSPFEWQAIGLTKDQDSTNAFTFSNTLWFTLGALMQQGSDIFPRSFSGRIVGSAWWFFTLILISSYTANLAAFLTIERLLTPIKSADDLAKQTKIEYGTYIGGSTQQFFEITKVSVYKRMWAYMRANKKSVMMETNEKGIKKVRESKGKYAFLCESPLNKYQNQKKPCNTMMVGDNLDSKGYGIATPLRSKYSRELNQVVLELREEGELHKLEQKWWYDKGECGAVDSKDSIKSALTLSNVSGIFHILIGGLVLSMIVALLEYMVHRHKRKKKILMEEKQLNYKPSSVKIVKKDPLEALKAAGYTEHENSGYTYNPPEQLTTFDGSPAKKREQTTI